MVSGRYDAVIFLTHESKSVLVVDVEEGIGLFERPLSVDDIKFFGSFPFCFSDKLTPSELKFKKAFNKYITSPRTATEAIIQVIKEMGLEKSTIGVEKESIPFIIYEKISKAFPEACFKDVSTLLRHIRMIKTDWEVERIKLCSEINEKALKAVIETISVGVSVWELVKTYLAEVARHKARPLFYLIAAGRNSAHLIPTYREDYRIQDGDIVRLDVGCEYMGYCSDLSRTVAVGKLDVEKTRLREITVKGYYEVLKNLKPGIPINKVYAEAMSTVKKVIPDYQRRHVGHGIGLEVHELPIINSHQTGVLEKNMVINMETPYLKYGVGGFAAEDTVRITDTGVEFITGKYLERLINV